MGKTTFDVLDNGIYRAYWRSHNTEEIQAYAEWFSDAYSQLSSGSTIRVLHDYREINAPPFNRLKEAMKNLKLKDDITLRVAHISDDFVYQLIMQNATLVAGMNANRKFFKSSEEAKAIEWLLET